METEVQPAAPSLQRTMMRKQEARLGLEERGAAPKPGGEDLERLLLQSQPGPHLLFPRSASEEQEFAEGFVKALEELHQQNQLERMELLGALPHSDLPLPVYTTLSGSSYPSSARDEPQTVPDLMQGGGGGDGDGDSPPLSPIDMDNQERIKAERKKLRNRIAASKCRKRKLERISRLEEKVQSLKAQNGELASTAGLLRQQVAQLKRKVLSHVSSGCQLLPGQVQAY